MSSPEHDSSISVDEFNMRGVEMSLEDAERTRLALVQYCSEAVLLFAEIDAGTENALSNGELEKSEDIRFFVEEDFLATPMLDGQLQRSLSLQLTNEKEDDSKQTLFLYMPIPDDIDLAPGTNLRSVPIPDVIYVEHRYGDDIIKRYLISRTEVVEYVSAFDTGEEVIKDEFHPERLERLLLKRVDSWLPFLTRLREDVINMKTIPQFVGKVSDLVPEAESSTDYSENKHQG